MPKQAVSPLVFSEGWQQILFEKNPATLTTCTHKQAILSPVV